MELRGMSEDRVFRGRRVEPARTIGKVMRAGGWIRQELERQGPAPDTDAWQGMSGHEVAVQLVQQAAALERHEDEAVAERRDEELWRAAGVLGCELQPSVEIIAVEVAPATA